MANQYSQRYATLDSTTAGSFQFDTDETGKDVAVSKLVYGADAAAFTRVTASVGLPVVLLTGAAAIGKLAANSGVDIGDVDVTSVPADPFGVNADAASATGSISAKLRFIAAGIAVTNAGTFAVQAAQSGTWTVTGTGGTFPVTDSGGSLTVDAPVGTPVFVRLSDGTAAITTLAVSLASVPSHAVTNAGTFVVQVDGTALTALQLLDDVVYTDDAAFTPATSKVAAIGFTFDDTTPDSVDEGDIGAGRMSANRCQFVMIRDNAGNERGLNVDASGNVTVNVTGTVTVGSHAVTNAGTFAVQAVCTNAGTFAVQATVAAGATNIAKAEDVASADADVGVPAMAVRKGTPANTSGTDGDYEMLQMSAGRLWVDASGVSLTVGTHAVTQSGTWDIGTVTTVTTCSTVTTVSTLTGSAVAHDGVDSGNPHKIGAKATTSLSGLTLVANADRTDLFAGIDGVQIVRTHCNLEDVVQERTTNTDGASTAFVSGLAAPGAGVRLWVTKVTVANSSASFCTVDLRDGAAGAVLWTLPVPATGGISEKFDPPLKLTANTALALDASAATTTLSISANGFKSKI